MLFVQVRRLVCTIVVPICHDVALFLQILGQDNHGYGSEHSKVDPSKKKMTLKARNVSSILLNFKR